MTRNLLSVLLFAAVASSVAGCGGGGGVSTPVNATPVASAGKTQTAYGQSQVTLDGSGSYDTDGDALSYSWTFASKPSGSAATLTNATAAKPTFTPDVAGDYVLKLVVTDGKATSTPSTVTVNAIPVTNVIDEAYPAVHQGDTVDLHLDNKQLVEVTKVTSSSPIYTYAEGVDYTVDLASGRISIVRGGHIDRNGNGTALLISYRLSL